MMKELRFHLAFIAAALLLCCIIPVSAVMLEVICKGQVATTDLTRNTITIKNPEQYGCAYLATGAPICSWKPMTSSSLTGTVPDAAAFTIFSGGENAIAASIGGPGEQWITLAKIFGPKDTEQLITDIVGDPRTIPLPLIGNYAVETDPLPDCSACSGTVCTAGQAKVIIRSSGTIVAERTMAAGDSFTYNGRNDGSGVLVKFVSGQAPAGSCPGKAGMTGPQAISVYLVRVTPPVSYGQVDIRTATTTRPDEVTASLQPTPASMAPVPTQSGPVTPFAISAGLIGAALIIFRR